MGQHGDHRRDVSEPRWSRKVKARAPCVDASSGQQVCAVFRAFRWRAGRTALVLFVLFSMSCGLIETHYFKDRVNEVTQERVARRYGPPHTVQPLQTGGETWVYYDRGSATASYAGYAESKYCRAYSLTFDKEGVLRDWNEQTCQN